MTDMKDEVAEPAILHITVNASQEHEQVMTWNPMDTAPKGSGDGNSDTREPGYVKPPRILLRFGDEAVAVAYWDWYYAEGGHGFTDGFAWIGPECGEPLNLHYSTAPDGWMELPK